MTIAYGWWGMVCWNGLSPDQQNRLITHGNLPIEWRMHLPVDPICRNGAAVAIEWRHDEAPGPRFYCLSCAALRLAELAEMRDV